MILEQKTNSLLICDYYNKRVVRLPGEEIIVPNVASGDDVGYPLYIFVDQDCSIYISDRTKHRVTKWIHGAQEGIVVAGGEGRGLLNPHGIVVDQSGAIYIADTGNHRIVRWLQGATEGTIIIGGDQLDHPCDLAFDRENNLYVLDYNKQRVQKFFVR